MVYFTFWFTLMMIIYWAEEYILQREKQKPW